MAGGKHVKFYFDAEHLVRLEVLVARLGSKSAVVKQAIDLLYRVLVDGECVCPENRGGGGGTA